MIKSDSIAKLAEALSKTQANLLGAHKDAKNPFFKSRYADLQSVWEACRADLTKNGLSVTQVVGTSNQNPTITTILMHSSGEYIGDTIEMNPVKNDPQGVGGAITYYRRYALAAIVGVHQIDDDANESSNVSKNEQVQKPPQSISIPKPVGVPMHSSDEVKRELYVSAGKKIKDKMKLTTEQAAAHIFQLSGKATYSDLTIDDLEKMTRKIEQS